MKKLVSVILLSFITVQSFSQNAQLAVDFSRYGTPITGPAYINRTAVHDLIHKLDRINRSKTPEEINKEILKNIEGTPFLNPEFISGEVYTSDGNKIENVLLRYNIFNNKMEAKFNESLFQLSENLIRRIAFEERTFDYLSYTIADKENAGYLELIHDGEWKIYCRFAKKFKEAQAQKAMQDKPNPAAFRDLPDIYLVKTGDNKVQGFKSKKELLSVFSLHKNEVQAFMKKNKLKHNNSADLKMLMTYYETL